MSRVLVLTYLRDPIAALQVDALKAAAPELGLTDYTGNQLYNGANAGAIDASNFTAYAYGNDEYFTAQRQKAIQQEQERVSVLVAKKIKHLQLLQGEKSDYTSLGPISICPCGSDTW